MNMSAIEDCKCEVQSIVDTMSSEIQFTLEHGFEKMQNNSNFKKWILDLEERIKQDTPSQLVASQKSWTLSIFGLKSKDYGLPDRFNNFEDFMAFSYGVAKTFSINAVSVTYESEDSDLYKYEYTKEFSTLSNFLEWTKNQFEFHVNIYDFKSSKEYACFGLNDPIKYSRGSSHISGRGTISSAKTKSYGVISMIFGKIELLTAHIVPHTVTFYRTPPTKKETNNKSVSCY